MGATLPLLVQHLVTRSGSVGSSVALLYFVNTFGSAVACYLCASFLLRDFGQSGSVRLAAGVNALVGISALLLRNYKPARADRTETSEAAKHSTNPRRPRIRDADRRNLRLHRAGI